MSELDVPRLHRQPGRAVEFTTKFTAGLAVGFAAGFIVRSALEGMERCSFGENL